MEIQQTQVEGSRWVIALDGEMDLYNADAFKTAVRGLLEQRATGIVVDLERLTYIDSSGIGALLYAFTQARNRAVGLCFVHVGGSVRTVIQLTSLMGFLPIEDSVRAGLARIGASASEPGRPTTPGSTQS